jgi:hypothetical protein
MFALARSARVAGWFFSQVRAARALAGAGEGASGAQSCLLLDVAENRDLGSRWSAS